MQIVLTRTAYNPSETLGELQAGNTKLYTIERPWLNNDPETSCVPDGTFDLVPYYSNKHQSWTWCLHNASLGIWTTPDMIPVYAEKNGRSTIEIHSANFAHELLGCIAPGLAHGIFEGQQAVLNSKAAMQALITVLAPDGDIKEAHGHTLLIKPLDGLKGTSDYMYEPK